MADTLYYNWTKPTVGGDDGTWGGELNTLCDDIDADLKAISDNVDAAQADADTNTANLAKFQASKADKINQALATGIVNFQEIEFDTEVFDEIGGFDVGGANPERFTAPADGKYMFHIAAHCDGLSTGDEVLGQIQVNGAVITAGAETADVPQFNFLAPAATTYVTTFNASVILDLSTDDYVTVLFAHDTGAGLDFDCALSVFRLG